MKIKETFELIGNGVMWILTASLTNEVFETISLILSIVISILIIVSKIISWYKKAKEDGKITGDEIKDGIDIVVGGVEDIKDKIEKKEEK